MAKQTKKKFWLTTKKDITKWTPAGDVTLEKGIYEAMRFVGGDRNTYYYVVVHSGVSFYVSPVSATRISPLEALAAQAE